MRWWLLKSRLTDAFPRWWSIPFLSRARGRWQRVGMGICFTASSQSQGLSGNMWMCGVHTGSTIYEPVPAPSPWEGCVIPTRGFAAVLAGRRGTTSKLWNLDESDAMAAFVRQQRIGCETGRSVRGRERDISVGTEMGQCGLLRCPDLLRCFPTPCVSWVFLPRASGSCQVIWKMVVYVYKSRLTM